MEEVIQCGKCKEDIKINPVTVILSNGTKRVFHEDCIDFKTVGMQNKQSGHKFNPPKPL